MTFGATSAGREEGESLSMGQKAMESMRNGEASWNGQMAGGSDHFCGRPGSTAGFHKGQVLAGRGLWQLELNRWKTRPFH